MTLFFFVVGLEIKREFVEGELNGVRCAVLPVCAAFGGMMVPAALFALVNQSGAGSRGWGIPMATDIALARGVLALSGSGFHSSLKLFLLALALAIMDDVGAIVVIAIFYSASINIAMFAASGASLALMVVLKRVGVRPVAVYTIIGVAMWVTAHEGGIHAAIAGVVAGLLAPARPFVPVELVDEAVLADVSTVQATHETVRLAGRRSRWLNGLSTACTRGPVS